MSYLDNYRSMVTGLTRGLRYARARYGIRLFGTIGLYADLISEGARQAFIARLPGHPEQAEDALNQVGADRNLFRYSRETRAQYAIRVANAWQSYAEAGSPIGLLREVTYWALITFPTSWPSHAPAILWEQGWAKFTFYFTSGSFSGWTTSTAYGAGNTYGKPDLLYGLSGALSSDIDALRRTVRKWKPSRSRATIVVATTAGTPYGFPGLVYGGGAVYTTLNPIMIPV
jgi:hypothetical protein